MTLTDLLLQNFNIELSMTRRTLERVPEDLAGWTPHPKSMPMGKLAMHIAQLPGMIPLCLSTLGFDVAGREAPDLAFTTRDDLLRTFDTHVQQARYALMSATDKSLSRPWSFTLGDRVLSENSRALTILHTCIGHLIHHRAQLGTYLRLNDLPVPPVYGPSADEAPGRPNSERPSHPSPGAPA